MCHSDDSRPPAPPEPGEVAEHGPVELVAADGTKVSAYRARPATPNGMNMVVLPDIRGLHPFYEALAQSFAQAGFETVAVDYFGRTAGTGDRDDSFDWKAHVPQVKPDHVLADVDAATKVFEGGPTFTVGFCFGGSHSWRLAASDLDLAGGIGFYGRPMMIEDVEDKFAKPLLLLVGGDDVATPVEEFHALDARLTESGKEHEMYVYDGAPHSYFDRSFGEWKEACEDSWRRILAFTAKHGGA